QATLFGAATESAGATAGVATDAPADAAATTPAATPIPEPDGHLTADQMARYARRTLAPTDLLATDDHLVGCVECRSRMVDEEGLQDSIRALERDIASAGPDVEHLSYEQVEAHAEGRMRGAVREVAEAHLEGC